MTEDKTKGLRKIDRLINKAKRERDKKGYRENLGYDSQRELEDYLSTLNLSYGEKTRLIALFYDRCEGI